ncbi:MAG: CinA family protein [Candidatus Methanomethylophilaceae archaeon]
MERGREAEQVISALRCRGLTLAVAESCTGGLVGKLITDSPGSSKVFLGGVVAYSDQVKVGMLDVPPGVIRNHGAVSAQTALSMADGVRKAIGADVGISCTGIAGPEGGTELKPVGLVCMAVSGLDDSMVEVLLFKGDRDRIRKSSAQHLLGMLGEFMEGKL